MVLSSLCPYHKTLLYQILKCMREYYGTSSRGCKNAHGLLVQTDNPLCCHLSSNLHQDMCSFGDYKTSNRCCLQACQIKAFPVTPVCICLKNMHCFSCQTMAIGCISSVVAPSSCGCYLRHQRTPPSCQSYVNGTCITPVGNVASAPFGPRKACDSFCSVTCSSSPPQLSPVPSDARGNMTDTSLLCSVADGKTCTNQPPPLFPFEEEGEEEGKLLFHKDCLNKGECVHIEVTGSPKDEKGTDLCTVLGSSCIEQRRSGTIVQGLMERSNENLKKTEPLEKTQNISTTVDKSLECRDDARFGRKTSAVLYNDNDHDYSRKELPCQPEEIFEKKSIQASFFGRKKTTKENEVCFDNSSFCQGVERENISDLTKSFERKETPDKSRRDNEEDAPPSACQLISNGSDVGCISEGLNIESVGDNQISNQVNCELTSCKPENDIDCQEMESSTMKDCLISVKGLPLGSHELGSEKKVFPLRSSNCCDLGRSRRNIVPPQRFSSYVTEPRKMYFAACFSESIFIRRASKDKVQKATATEDDSQNMERDQSCSAPVLEEISNAVSNIKKLDEDEQACDKLNELKRDTTAAEEKAVDDGRKKWVSPRRTKRHEDSRSHSLLKSSYTQSDNHDSKLERSDSRNSSPENTLTTENASFSSDCHPVLQYTSPIRLMLVSPVASENGIRYTLKSVAPGPTNDGETFDPCEQSSWGGNINTAISETGPLSTCIVRDENSLQKSAVIANDASRPSPSKDGQKNGKETCPIPEITASPPKRKPGRPKKLGPQIEKLAKRPIGRPPKQKDKNSKCNDKGEVKSLCDNPASTLREEKDELADKNLKITVVYGRSRRIKRLVSEDNIRFRRGQEIEHQDGGKNCDRSGNVLAFSKIAFSDKLPGQTKNFNFVGAMRDRKCVPTQGMKSKCHKQKHSFSLRKPGRPPKVKISGISVTVTTVSPKQRKIHMNSEITELDREPSQMETTIILGDVPSKEQMTINSVAPHDRSTQKLDEGTMNNKTPLVPLRHSARERKPSIYLLHSVATSRSFSRSNALLRRSRKLLLNKTSSEPCQKRSLERSREVASLIPERSSRNQGQDLSFWSGISADSIFTSNEAVKWWPTSATCEEVNEELSRRIQLMSDTWIPDAVESSKSWPSEMEADLKERTSDRPKKSVSAVKMLFQKHCNLEDLCAWFMQTTETQSLAIVKRASARNPYEIIQFNPNRISKGTTIRPSPQAERLKKHVKKFAKIVPKSPMMHFRALERFSRSGKLHVKRRLFPKRSSTIAGIARKWQLESRGKLVSKFKSTLRRVKAKFMTRMKLKCTKRKSVRGDGPSSDATHRNPTFGVESPLQIRQVDTHLSPNSSVPEERHCKDFPMLNTKGETLFERDSGISSKEWSPGTMRECRVFLKKIASPETKSIVEECNLCTVQLCDISSAKPGLSESTDHGDTKTESVNPENVRNGRIRRTTRNMSSQYPKELWVQTLERKAKRKSGVKSEAQPVKKGKTI